MICDGDWCEEQAKAFARAWYDRPQSGCDEQTLSILARWLVEHVRNEAVRAERERVTTKVQEILNAGT